MRGDVITWACIFTGVMFVVALAAAWCDRRAARRASRAERWAVREGRRLGLLGDPAAMASIRQRCEEHFEGR